MPGPDNRFLQVTADLTVVGEHAPWTPQGEVATAMHWLGDRDWLVDVPSGVVLWTEGAATGMLVAPKASVSQVEVESAGPGPRTWPVTRCPTLATSSDRC